MDTCLLTIVTVKLLNVDQTATNAVAFMLDPLTHSPTVANDSIKASFGLNLQTTNIRMFPPSKILG